jgi:alpha-glutamyl/putrescinyl thymine pyrophosphorylase clade 1
MRRHSNPRTGGQLRLVVDSQPELVPVRTRILSKSQVATTDVFETYWRFAAERQNIFLRRVLGTPPPWSSDPILSRYRFTNAYRVIDRVSQFLIRNVQAAGPQDSRALFFRTILFKLFNRVQTWEMLQGVVGTIHPDTYDL